MKTDIENKFDAMGSEVIVNESERTLFGIDVRDGKFIINKAKEVAVQIIDLDKKDRHLLLLASVPTGRVGMFDKQRYLCGHDERDWFTCAIPNVVKTVFEAKEELKPKELRGIELGKVKKKNKQKRHRKVEGLGKVHRQGEFMFVPVPGWKPTKGMYIRTDEPMRSNGRPHVASEAVRTGGRLVWTRGGSVMEDAEFKQFQKANPTDARFWRQERAEPTVYVRGTIRHPDHKTLRLDGWFKVLVNTEKDAKFAKNVLFID